jgi:hypothetical protein
MSVSRRDPMSRLLGGQVMGFSNRSRAHCWPTLWSLVEASISSCRKYSREKSNVANSRPRQGECTQHDVADGSKEEKYSAARASLEARPQVERRREESPSPSCGPPSLEADTVRFYDEL